MGFLMRSVERIVAEDAEGNEEHRETAENWQGMTGLMVQALFCF
jgi:hypothetical protein